MPKKDESPQAKLSLDDLLKQINKKYKKLVVARASTSKALEIPRLETGIFAVDVVTGGGLPIGRISGISGKKSSGKTVLALKTVASAQRYCRFHGKKMLPTGKKLCRCLDCGFRGAEEGDVCPDCAEKGTESVLAYLGDLEYQCPECKEYHPFETVWIDSEGAWENKWASTLGVNCHHVYVIRAEYAEQAIDVSDYLLRNGGCDLMVIDTIAHLTPSKEIEDSSEDWQMGLQARLINKMLRKLVSAQNAPDISTNRRPTIILLNQVRVKLGVMYGNPETKPGGMGQEFATSVDLKLWPGKYIQDSIGNTLSMVTNFRCEKNKTAPPRQEGNYRVWLANGSGKLAGDTEEFEAVVGHGFKHKLFGEGKWTWKEDKFKNKEELIQFLRDNPPMFDDVRTTLLSMHLGTIASDKDALKVRDDEPTELEQDV